MLLETEHICDVLKKIPTKRSKNKDDPEKFVSIGIAGGLIKRMHPKITIHKAYIPEENVDNERAFKPISNDLLNELLDHKVVASINTKQLQLFIKVVGKLNKDWQKAIGIRKEDIDKNSAEIDEKIKEAIIWTDKGIGVIGDNPELLAVKAMALGRNGELDRALGYSDRAIKQGGDSPIIWLARGDIFVTSDTHSAERCFRKAIECDKNNPFVLLRIGISYLTVQDFAPAISYLKRATILCPESSFILFLLGNSYRALGLIGNAKNYYKQALKINPGYLECRKALYEISHRNLSQRFWHWLQRMFGKKEEDFYGKD